MLAAPGTETPPELTPPRWRARVGWVGQVLSWLVILAVGALLAVAVVVPRIVGATPYTILTGSMRPGLPPGTLVVARPVDVDRIGVGDVITYQLRSGEPTVVTHRVIAQGLDGLGQPIFRTRGDANPSPDQAWVKPVQVKGRLWYAVPRLGRLTLLIGNGQRQIATLLVGGGLAAYAAYMFIGAARDRRKGPGTAGQQAGRQQVSP